MHFCSTFTVNYNTFFVPPVSQSTGHDEDYVCKYSSASSLSCRHSSQNVSNSAARGGTRCAPDTVNLLAVLKEKFSLSISYMIPPLMVRRSGCLKFSMKHVAQGCPRNHPPTCIHSTQRCAGCEYPMLRGKRTGA